MTLRKKFILLWGFIASTVLVCLGTSYVVGVLLERELSWPYEHSTRALAVLSDFEKQLFEQINLFHTQEFDPLVAAEKFDQHHSAMLEDLELFEFVPGARGENSTGIARNLRDRAVAARDICLEALRSDDEALMPQAEGHLDRIHMLVERIDEQLLNESTQAITYGRRMSRFHQVVTASGIVAALLTGLLGSMLMQRWVVAPVQDLRAAAREIAQGNFAYRLPEPDRKDEIALLSREVNHMASTIESMQREAVERERFAAIGEMVRRIVHNLRNPLAGIRNMAELTLRQSDGDTAIAENQQTVIRSIDRFDVWLKGLLLATKNQEIDPQPINPERWLGQVVQALQPLATARQATVTIDCSKAPPEIIVDAMQFEQAVTAVITNALQVSPPQSVVRVSLASENDAAEWTLDIADEGPGVPVEYHSRIFEPYFTTKADGTGIGLATTRMIVTKHEGSIALLPSNGRGARFIIRMPDIPGRINEPNG